MGPYFAPRRIFKQVIWNGPHLLQNRCRQTSTSTERASGSHDRAPKRYSYIEAQKVAVHTLAQNEIWQVMKTTQGLQEIWHGRPRGLGQDVFSQNRTGRQVSKSMTA